MSTMPALAAHHCRANGRPPVSQQRVASVRVSYTRGDTTHLSLSANSRFCGLGSVCLFHGWFLSTGLPSGSSVTNVGSFSQLSKYELPSRILIARLISTRSVVISSPPIAIPGVMYRLRPQLVIVL